MLGITNSAVMALNARERTAQVDQRQMPPPHGGTKRRSTQEKAEASRKGRRREGSHEKVSSGARSGILPEMWIMFRACGATVLVDGVSVAIVQG